MLTSCLRYAWWCLRTPRLLSCGVRNFASPHRSPLLSQLISGLARVDAGRMATPPDPSAPIVSSPGSPNRAAPAASCESNTTMSASSSASGNASRSPVSASHAARVTIRSLLNEAAGARITGSNARGGMTSHPSIVSTGPTDSLHASPSAARQAMLPGIEEANVRAIASSAPHRGQTLARNRTLSETSSTDGASSNWAKASRVARRRNAAPTCGALCADSNTDTSAPLQCDSCPPVPVRQAMAHSHHPNADQIRNAVRTTALRVPVTDPGSHPAL